MFQDFTLKIRIIKIFLIIAFISCWFSISTNFHDLFLYKKNEDLSVSDLINFLRHGIVYLLLPILFFILVFYRKHLFQKDYFIFYLLILYFLAQLPGLLLSDNSIENVSLIISSISSILPVVLIKYFFLFHYLLCL